MAKTGFALATFLLGGFVVGVLVGGTAAKSQPAATPTEPLVTGIGGVFFKTEDPQRLRAWYREHLGVGAEGQGVNFVWRERDADIAGYTVWAAFPRDTQYFGSGDQRVMINYRVRDLDALLAKLEAEGVRRDGGIDEYWYGRFAWILDGDGNRVELWEPAAFSPAELERRLRAE
jgi:catechol 2,3-dioxygenase-like lactoylglutathione lyase family enzyme